MKGKLGLLVIALLAVASLGTLLGCAPDIAQGVISADDRAVIDKLVAATLSDDIQAMTALYAKDAILDDYLSSPATRTRGPDKIVAHVANYPNLDWQPSGEPFEIRGYIIQPLVMLDDGTPIGHGVQVLELNSDEQIQHIWVSASPRVPPAITESLVGTLVAANSDGLVAADDVQVVEYKAVGNWAAAIVNAGGSDASLVMFKWQDQKWAVLWEDSTVGIGQTDVEESWMANGTPRALVDWLRSVDY